MPSRRRVPAQPATASARPVAVPRTRPAPPPALRAPADAPMSLVTASLVAAGVLFVVFYLQLHVPGLADKAALFVLVPGPALVGLALAASGLASPRAARLAVFASGFLALHVAASLSVPEPWDTRLVDTAYYAIPAFGTVALLGLTRARLGPGTRIGLSVAIALLALLLVERPAWLGLSRPWALYFLDWWLLLLPVWSAVAVTGTSRFRWGAGAAVGATLLVIGAWRPLHGSFPELAAVFTAGGTLRPYTIPELYSIVTLKFFHETAFILFGLLLFFGRMPFVQKVPRLGDLRETLRPIGAHNRYGLGIGLGLGCLTFLAAFGGSFLLDWLLRGVPAVQGGADDAQVFARMTPELVLLLSLAAGVGEELVFRGVLQPALERAWGRVFPGRTVAPAALAILVAGILFGIVHAGYGNWIHILLPLGFGLLAGLVFRLFGILPAIYAHTVIDVFAFGYDAAQTRPWVWDALGILFYANILGVVLAGAWVVYRWFTRWERRRFATPAE